MPRFSLKTLLITAAVIPVAAFVLVKATPLTASLVGSAVVVTGSIAVLASLAGDGELRVVARGFAVAAAIYAVFSFGIDPYLLDNRLLPSKRLISWLFDLVVVATPIPTRPPIPASFSVFPMYVDFGFIGESYVVLIAGLIGWWFSGWLYRRRQNANQSRIEENNP